MVLLAGYLVLQNKRLQRSVVDVVTNSLSQQVGSAVSIDQIEWNFPNSFVLKNVCVKDLNRDTMLYMDRTKVSINLMRLFSSQISFRTIQFTGLEASLSVDSTQTPNFQFFIDAFKPSDNDTLPFTWSMDVESVAFEDCQISYKNPYKEKVIGRFEPNDMRLYDIDGCLFIRSFVTDSVHILLDNMSFKEKSGLVVDNISATVSVNEEELSVKNFDLATPNSLLDIKELTAYHDHYEAFSDPLNRLRFRLEFGQSDLRLSDFSVFLPALDMLDQPFNINGKIYGSPEHFQLYGISVKYGTASCVAGSAFVKNIVPDISKVSIDADIDRISSNASELSDILWIVLKRDIELPHKLDSLGTFTYKGTLKGGLADMATNGQISSNLGVMNVSVMLESEDLQLNTYRVEGKIQSSNCHLNRVLGKESGLGNVAFNLGIVLDKHADRDFSLSAKGNVDSLFYKDYCYQNLAMNGTFDRNGFDGSLIMSDPNAELSFLGKVDLKKENPLFHFSANVSHIDLCKTHLVKASNEASVSFNVETNFTGRNIDELEGAFSVDNFIFVQDEKEMTLNNLSLSAERQSNGTKKLSIFSDILNGSLEGHYSFARLPIQLYNVAQHYFPALIKEPKKVPEGNSENNFTFDFTIDNLEPINEIYPMPVVVIEESRLKGFFNEKNEQFRVRLEAPQIRRGGNTLADFLLLCENPKDKLKTLCRSTILPKNKIRHPYYVSLQTLTERDDVDLDFSFSNTTATTYSGKIDLKALFKNYEKGKGLTADFTFKPTHVYLNDTTWTIRQSKISIDGKQLQVDSFMFSHESQHLCLNGVCTETDGDSLNVHFSDLALGYFSDILANPNISFNGVADGDIYLFRLFNDPYFKGNLYVYDAAINECVLGDMSVNSYWKEREKCIGFDAELLSPFKERTTLSKSLINGGVFLGNDSLFIGGDLKNVDMRFLRKYLKKVLANNTGTVSGKVKAYGKFGDIGLEGMAYVKDMAFDVDYLKTSYVLSDSVKLTPHTIELNQVQVFDTEGNYAVVSGMMLHDAFRNFKFAFDLKCDNILAMNTKEEDNETFYGKAYAAGVAHFSGTPETVNINLDMRTNPGTLVSIPIDGTSSAKESNFVTFVEVEEKKTMAERRKERREKLKQIAAQNNSSSTNLQLAMNLEATPDAQVHLIMDARQGDIIRANGTGSLRMDYISKDNSFKMYGGYEIESGDYLFTIQSIISRKFEIEKGSTVRWTGDPTLADINITAKYSLNTSLSDIVSDPNLRTNTSLVNCLLSLSGTINAPNIKFDIELPNSDDDVRGKLRSVINTEEAMNRNIASLLALGHFYNMDKNISSVATTELSSVGFSTLSSQLTNWISKMNQDLTIGLNYRPTSTGTDGTISSSEFDVALSTQLLNDRLLLNGNFGYRDEVAETDNISNSIIDFDIEYKLGKTGKLRTKGFNRSNNSYFKQAPNTQGLGLVYREDFDTFSGLLKSYWEALKRPNRKEKKQADKAKKQQEETAQEK